MQPKPTEQQSAEELLDQLLEEAGGNENRPSESPPGERTMEALEASRMMEALEALRLEALRTPTEPTLEERLQALQNLTPKNPPPLPSSSSSESDTEAKTDDDTEVKMDVDPATQWSCERCTFVNARRVLICQVCTIGRQPLNSSTGWSCSACTFLNPAVASACQMCRQGRRPTMGMVKIRTKDRKGLPKRKKKAKQPMGEVPKKRKKKKKKKDRNLQRKEPSPRVSDSEPENELTCKICYANDANVWLTCSHRVCDQCLVRWWDTELEKPEPKLSCPIDTCDARPREMDVQACGPAMVERYHAAMAKAMLREDDTVRLCPKADCNAWGFLEPDCVDATCVKCSHTWNEDWRAVPSCPIRAWRWVVNFWTGELSERESELWKYNNSKLCPGCGAYIQKSSGCNHMTCKKCNAEFCYICEQPYPCGAFMCYDKKHRSSWASGVLTAVVVASLLLQAGIASIYSAVTGESYARGEELVTFWGQVAVLAVAVLGIIVMRVVRTCQHHQWMTRMQSRVHRIKDGPKLVEAHKRRYHMDLVILAVKVFVVTVYVTMRPSITIPFAAQHHMPFSEGVVESFCWLIVKMIQLLVFGIVNAVPVLALFNRYDVKGLHYWCYALWGALVFYANWRSIGPTWPEAKQVFKLALNLGYMFVLQGFVNWKPPYGRRSPVRAFDSSYVKFLRPFFNSNIFWMDRKPSKWAGCLAGAIMMSPVALLAWQHLGWVWPLLWKTVLSGLMCCAIAVLNRELVIGIRWPHDANHNSRMSFLAFMFIWILKWCFTDGTPEAQLQDDEAARKLWSSQFARPGMTPAYVNPLVPNAPIEWVLTGSDDVSDLQCYLSDPFRCAREWRELTQNTCLDDEKADIVIPGWKDDAKCFELNYDLDCHLNDAKLNCPKTCRSSCEHRNTDDGGWQWADFNPLPLLARWWVPLYAMCGHGSWTLTTFLKWFTIPYAIRDLYVMQQTFHVWRSRTSNVIVVPCVLAVLAVRTWYQFDDIFYSLCALLAGLAIMAVWAAPTVFYYVKAPSIFTRKSLLMLAYWTLAYHAFVYTWGDAAWPEKYDAVGRSGLWTLAGTWGTIGSVLSICSVGFKHVL